MSISTCALREEGNRLLKAQKEGKLYISIHALREEGDLLGQGNQPDRRKISIHALREEGDVWIWPTFIPMRRFLSTPSARRATCEAFFLRRQLCISIHALREEGDCTF